MGMKDVEPKLDVPVRVRADVALQPHDCQHHLDQSGIRGCLLYQGRDTVRAGRAPVLGGEQ
jgi:hypothetical protein